MKAARANFTAITAINRGLSSAIEDAAYAATATGGVSADITA